MVLRKPKMKPYTMELERDNWVIVHVAKGSTFPLIVPNICNGSVAKAIAAKYESSGIIILAVCTAGELADRLADPRYEP